MKDLFMPTNKGYTLSWKDGTRTLRNGKEIPCIQDFYTKSKKVAEQKKQQLEDEGKVVDGISECIF